jgi:hypothetical protein
VEEQPRKSISPAAMMAQIRVLQTKVENLESEKAALIREQEQMAHDVEEYEQQLEKLAIDLKDQDYCFLDVLDENEEIEN